MTGSGQTDSLNERDSVDVDTSVEPEPEASQDQELNIDQAENIFPRCEYYFA